MILEQEQQDLPNSESLQVAVQTTQALTASLEELWLLSVQTTVWGGGSIRGVWRHPHLLKVTRAYSQPDTP